MNYGTNSNVAPAYVVHLHVSKLPANHVKRDDLISMMLQDRNTLRVISAPHGFGKSALAREYAVRMFSGGTVSWVDASAPDFLRALDEDGQQAFLESGISPDLLVLDNLPWLHEQRARTLSHRIDSMIYSGTEVVVTTVPSCDCLSNLQAERLLVHAEDMLTGERELTLAHIDEGVEGQASAMRQWRTANEGLFGRVPYVAWGNTLDAQFDCLRALFSERLTVPLFQVICTMLLLESGDTGMIEAVLPSLRNEDIQIIAHDYPIFGIDSVAGTFSVGQFALADLRAAIIENSLGEALLLGKASFVERTVAVLFGSGHMRRGVDVLDVFCSDEKCAKWLEERGWDLLDRGELSLVSSLLERCPERIYARHKSLQALHAWLSGLSGNPREACHISERLLGQFPIDAEEVDRVGLMARLAIAMFGENAILYKNCQRYSGMSDPQDAVSFLASVVDACSNVEIARAFHFDSGDDDIRYERNRKTPTKQRIKALVTLFTGNSDRFQGHPCFMVALHLLAYVDSPRIHRLLQELGCDAVVDMRRNGVQTFTQAILVRDLWNTGYFGLTGPVTDRRDVKVLDGASHMLTLLAQFCGYGAIDVPWESHASGLPGKKKTGIVTVGNEAVEFMNVRLFGALEVTVGERYISEGKWRKKARALFAILILNLGRDVPRDELFKQIWPSASRASALDNFYILWSNCVSIVGESPYLERNGEFCRMDPRYVKSDVGEFEQLSRHLLAADRDSNYLLDTYAKIEALYRGCLLPSENKVSIINIQRERYRALFVDAMVAATDCALRIGDTRIALWFARKAIEEDPSREDVYRALMKAQIAAGQRCPAIKTYLSCREFLQSTLGLDPSVETRGLYDTLITTDPSLLRLDSSSFTR